MVLRYGFAFLKHGSLWAYRVATYGVLLLGVLFLALVIGLRYLVLPHIDNYREPIAQALSSAMGSRVSIGAISGSWQGSRPELSFMDVKVLADTGTPALALARVNAVLGWSSLLHAAWRFESLAIYGPALEIRRDAQGVIWVAGVALRPREGGGSGFGDWVLAQREIVVRDATLTWSDEMRAATALKLEKVNLRLYRDAAVHRFGLSAVPPAELASPLQARGEFVGQDMRELQQWNGKLYLAIDQVDLAVAQNWIAPPFELTSGSGALRLWLELNGTQLGAATAELRLANVRTRVSAQLPELALAAVQGRLGWTRHGEQTRVFANSFGFTLADGRRLAPVQFSFTRSASAAGKRHCDLTLSGLDLALITHMAEFLPLDAPLHERLARLDPAGSVQDAALSWDGSWGSGPYTAKVRFAGLSVRPDGALPGFHGLSGQVDANERGGTVMLSASSAGLELPQIFSGPIAFDFLTASAAWTQREGTVDVTIRNASFANEHAAGTLTGSYRGEAQGPGSVDLSGTLVRAEARDVWRYIPAALAGPQAWLKRALQAGEAKDTHFRLRGALKDFPFRGERNGIFEVRTRASGVTLDYAAGWPPISGINGDVVFRGERMDVRAQSGLVLGVQLSQVQASIAQLGQHAEHLVVKGDATGATPGFLRFVEASPVAESLDRFIGQIKASGDARLALELGLDLHQIKDSTIKGALTLQNNLVTLDPRLPPLDQFGARIAFTERRFSLSDGRARLFGTPVSFEASTAGGGDITANIAGTLDMDAVRMAMSYPALAFLDGTTAWRASVAVRNKVTNVRVHSDLVGLRSSLPAPLAKAAAAKLPLRVDLREQPGRRPLLTANLGQVAAAQLVLDAAAPGGIGRGIISLGEGAEAPVGSGLLIRGNVDVVDADLWSNVLAGGTGGASAVLAGVDLRIGMLYAHRRRFHDLNVQASRQDEHWQIALAGREIAGSVSWSDVGEGELQARLTKLALPPITTVIQAGKPEPVDAQLPAVDLIADGFSYEGMNLGRLAVLGKPEPSGWQLRNLEIVNPESRFSMNGHWAMGTQSQTDVTVKLAVSDVGRFFGRLGWPNAVRGGKASLEGPLKWSGNPARFDIPSLSGQLKLEAKDGRFLEIDPGVAKLLGILSLQALPKRVTLDFRDVFSKGFSFDRIAADLKITQGVAATDNFVMEGSAARVAMHGQVDLAAETQNLAVRVTPSLSEGIAIAGAIVNPAIGVAALIAQKALKDPLSKMASFDYTITGTWADPRIAGTTKAPPKQTGR